MAQGYDDPITGGCLPVGCHKDFCDIENHEGPCRKYKLSAIEKHIEKRTAEMTKELFSQDALQRAIENLGAVEVAPGRYAWQPNQDDWRVWRVVNKYEILGLEEGKLDPFLCGCMMPTWWTPEQRFAFCVVSARTGKRMSHICIGEPPNDNRDDALRYERITADLETGEEVPA